MNQTPSFFRLLLGAIGLAFAITAGIYAWNSPGPRTENAPTPTISADTDAHSECRIIALGDSITAGYELDPADAYPAQLEAKLRKAGYPCAVTNAGVSGDTSKGLLDRLEFTLGSDHYDLAILTIGGNDGLRLLPTPELEKNIREMLATLKGRNIPVVLAGMQIPSNAGPYAKDFREVYPRIAKSAETPLYPFFLEGVAMKPKLNLPDGIHPNREGYGIISENLAKFIEK